MTPAKALFVQQPWLIVPEALSAIYSAAHAYFDDPGKPLPPAPPESEHLSIDDGVAVIAIDGPIMRNPDLVSEILFGATDTDELIDAVKEAHGRDGVSAIFLDIDSPGGMVNRTPELAQAVADASRVKPTYAFTAGQICSAACWIASQANADSTVTVIPVQLSRHKFKTVHVTAREAAETALNALENLAASTAATAIAQDPFAFTATSGTTLSSVAIPATGNEKIRVQYVRGQGPALIDVSGTAACRINLVAGEYR